MAQIAFRRPRTRLHLPGPKRVNWADPITAGLSFLHDCAYFHPLPDVCARGGQVFSVTATNALGVYGGVLGGAGLVCPQGLVNNVVSTTYTVPTTRGTGLAYLTAGNFNGTDLNGRFVFAFQNGSGTDWSIQKDGSGNWINGWHSSGHDDRATTSASGTFSSGTSFVVGCTWDTTDTLNYCNGKKIGNKGSAPTTFSTSGIACQIGAFWNGSSLTGAFWNGTIAGTGATVNGVHWAAIWDRVLSPPEIRRLNDDPGCLFVTDEDFLWDQLSHSVPAVTEDVFYSWRE